MSIHCCLRRTVTALTLAVSAHGLAFASTGPYATGGGMTLADRQSFMVDSSTVTEPVGRLVGDTGQPTMATIATPTTETSVARDNLPHGSAMAPVLAVAGRQAAATALPLNGRNAETPVVLGTEPAESFDQTTGRASWAALVLVVLGIMFRRRMH